MVPNTEPWTAGSASGRLVPMGIVAGTAMILVGVAQPMHGADFHAAIGEHAQPSNWKQFEAALEMELPRNVVVRSAAAAISDSEFESLAADIAGRQVRMPQDFEQLIAENLSSLYL